MLLQCGGLNLDVLSWISLPQAGSMLCLTIPYQVYHDGILVADRLGITSHPSVTAIDTKIVIGRRFTEVNDFYSSLQMDELLFFNCVSGDDDVKQLSR